MIETMRAIDVSFILILLIDQGDFFPDMTLDPLGWNARKEDPPPCLSSKSEYFFFIIPPDLACSFSLTEAFRRPFTGRA
jgi:hypothetical protein